MIHRHQVVTVGRLNLIRDINPSDYKTMLLESPLLLLEVQIVDEKGHLG